MNCSKNRAGKKHFSWDKNDKIRITKSFFVFFSSFSSFFHFVFCFRQIQKIGKIKQWKIHSMIIKQIHSLLTIFLIIFFLEICCFIYNCFTSVVIQQWIDIFICFTLTKNRLIESIILFQFIFNSFDNKIIIVEVVDSKLNFYQ